MLTPHMVARSTLAAATLAAASWFFAAPLAKAQPAGLDALATCAAKNHAARTACGHARGAKNCWETAKRTAVDCARGLSGKRRTNWAVFDTCEGEYSRAVRLADCGRAGPLRDCLAPHIRALTSCRRVASGESAVDWKKFDQCATTRSSCEEPCGRTSTRVATECRRKCFHSERACERAQLD